MEDFSVDLIFQDRGSTQAKLDSSGTGKHKLDAMVHQGGGFFCSTYGRTRLFSGT